ncbi:hypothetical protein FYZ48_28910 [Gimesia chilikensis]|uniref:hypothetical protein n=1 Tax=Gimesia chilikensis TaxID=2605989 RepID=UPI0011EE4460|nr:hypothetical protein [Gimesia chilikensis]KAA0132131.1 hypothetical protein FYZ48_28910 [Gimesia chilikensis]
MTQKIFALGFFILLITISMTPVVHSQSVDSKKTKKQSGPLGGEEIKKENDVLVKYPSTGLTFSLRQNRETLIINGDGTIFGGPFHETARINRELFEWIGSQKQIKKIYIEMVFFNQNDSAALQQLDNLETIIFLGTNVDDKTIDHLSKIESLKNITIKVGNISDRSVSRFAQMKNLKYLALDQNRFFPIKAASTLKKALPDAQILIY